MDAEMWVDLREKKVLLTYWALEEAQLRGREFQNHL